jgi:malate dehydrogenase (oxaloacetate-decarboxylating)
MENWEVFAREAAAVGMKAQEQGVARMNLTYDQLYAHASEIIARSRRLTRVMMDEGLIAPPPHEG